MTRTCKTCKETKLISKFPKREGNWYRHTCKTCKNKRDREVFRKDNPYSTRYHALEENKKLSESGHKRCTRCKQILLLTSFTQTEANCKPCRHALYLDNKDTIIRRNKENYYKRTYGITREELGTECVICKKSTDLVIDHDHDSGKVRGLLCRQCNVALGLFKDNKKILHKAWRYLCNFK